MSVELDKVFERVERLLSQRNLPHVERSTSYGTPSLKVGGKSFVRLKDAETLVLLCPIEQKELLLEVSPEIYFQTDQYAGWPAVLARLEVIGDDELALRLEECWRFKAPKKIADIQQLSPQ
jgi:hypothetical protein